MHSISIPTLFRYYLLVITFLSLSAFGCAQSGAINVSQPKIWREDAIMMSKGREIAELRKFGEKVDVAALQGNRQRSSETDTRIKVEASLISPEMPSPTVTESSDAGGTSSGQSKNNKSTKEAGAAASAANEDPIDALQRINDFQAAFEGAILGHLRDTHSEVEGYSLYLLGFDISILPDQDGFFQDDYNGYVRFEIIGAGNNDIVVYAISPENFAVRFSESASLKNNIDLAALVAAKYSSSGFDLGGQLKKQYSDLISKLERYPIVSGFIDDQRAFGWVFHPNPVIKNGKVKSSLVPAFRHCYALVLVKDKGISAPKWVYAINEKMLEEKINDEDIEWFKALREEYNKILNKRKDTSVTPEKLGIDSRYEKLDKLKRFKDDEKDKVTKEYTDSGREPVGGKYVKDLTKTWVKSFIRTHQEMLEFLGQQGKDGVADFRIKYVSGWIKKSDPKVSDINAMKTRELNVSLPDKVDRTLEAIWAVMPDKSPGNEESWVSIKGYGFSNDPQVFIGNQKALETIVFSREIVLAKFPKYSKDNDIDKDSCFRVKVFSAGDSMTSPDGAFCYTAPFDSPAPSPATFSVTSLHPRESAPKSILKIKANMAVMDKVEKVVIGDLEVPIDKKLHSREEDRLLEFAIPENKDNKTAPGLYEIHLIFKKNSGIVAGDRYAVPFSFKYLR